MSTTEKHKDRPRISDRDPELDAERGTWYVDGLPYSVPHSEETRPVHGPVRVYRRDASGEMRLVEIIEPEPVPSTASFWRRPHDSYFPKRKGRLPCK